MAPPQQLAFPPTALRNVAAGLVVGNPIGSSGTRAKALTSAELKAIVEASGISYLPLAGGTLTGALSLGANSMEAKQINLTTRGYGIGFGQANLFPGFDGYGDWLFGQSQNHPYPWGGFGGAAGHPWFGIGSTGFFGWATSTTVNSYDDIDTRLYRGPSAGIIEQRNGLTAQCLDIFETYTSGTNNGKLRFKATSSGHQIGSARATSGSNRRLMFGHSDASNVFTESLAVETTGNVTFAPLSSVTLATNGQFSVEMTSNTAGNLVYRGSDGTTRRMALTFS